ncbi:hypothetical protein ECG_09195 [Echinococcus granulosus]|uniref:Uncharacterized protein n=1 Tax=Echinococcus granulosus TaxID=6210 RepID=W6U6E9_ECHGR|nr:hypothetical protein EGR_08403 [Echinococcus granulosus]EUB56760.1 hypothetical protein EGR_08403 [Echinococcus granulosus]KAH9278568.1 hypothetical protein ECG_09195 [Echinococcus granulosus]
MSAPKRRLTFMNAHLLFTLLVAVVAADADYASTPPWYSRLIKKLNTTLVQNAYYAKCLVDSPVSTIDCKGVAYGAGLRAEAAKDSARYYASATGDYRCGHFVGQCVIRQYSK